MINIDCSDLQTVCIRTDIYNLFLRGISHGVRCECHVIPRFQLWWSNSVRENMTMVTCTTLIDDSLEFAVSRNQAF
jgi:hypothetical protein